MSEKVEAMFATLRRGPWNVDPMSTPQEGMPGNGNPESSGWIADDAITADTIQANAVTAGKVDADAITAREILANTVTAAEIAANTITANEIAANTITANEIAANTITASEIAANTITATEIAADSITANEIAANAITATELAADSVITSKILAANVVSSKIELTVSGKNFGANDGSAGAPGVFFDAANTVGLSRNAAGDVALGVGTLGEYLQVSASAGQIIVGEGHLAPNVNGTFSCGTSGQKWSEVWAVNGTIQTSDKRLKRDIADEPLGLNFIRRLRPRVYRWRDTADTQSEVLVDQGTLERESIPLLSALGSVRAAQMRGEVSDDDASIEVGRIRAALHEIHERHVAPAREARRKRRPGRRFHHGLIAQEVKSALDAEGIDDAAFWKVTREGEQGLVYEELIAPLIRAVQELADRLEPLDDDR